MTGWGPSLGAVPGPAGTTFRVWAPKPSTVDLEWYGPGGSARHISMQPEAGGYWSCVTALPAGTRYRYRVERSSAFPDPCSRSQPDGVHGPSQVVDPGAFAWTDDAWESPDPADLVYYECHIGTFTPGGSFDAAIAELPRLAALGITAVEVMPVAAFPGRWNWGYDGVALFAPAAQYGGPEAFRRFVNAAHGAGLAVVLDVVYNHFGPDGNYTAIYSNEYLTERYHTPWGGAVNFDGQGSAEVRAFFRENLLHWVHEYHIDGFRFDATHSIFDASPVHILADLSGAVRANRRSGRRPYLVAESHENDVRYLKPVADGGFGFDAVWADDFHHSLRTLIHRETDGYFEAFEGTGRELARTIGQGFLYEGQFDAFMGEPRGTPARGQPWLQFVYCIQNHDQVGNRAFGQRLNTTAALEDFLAASLLLLVLPQSPLLFQGQEFLAASPFLYFTDHNADLGRLVTEGRRNEFARFRAFADAGLRARIPDPQAEETFHASRLRPEEARTGLGSLCQDLYGRALELRAGDPVLRTARRERVPLTTTDEGAAISVLIEAGGSQRLVVANFGEAVDLPAPPGPWRVALASNEARFGGNGAPFVVIESGVHVPRHAAGFLIRG